ncbi:MAG: hypothetical protein IJA34_10360 [Lachnospiraceae bacterium]|nr:hypothetical protein [Lachnospiraceae bacterium]
MGLFDKFANAVKNFDYEGATESFSKEIEKKQSSIESRARNEIRQKARNASDEVLRHNLQKAIDNNNFIMQEEIEKEMERRGMY